MRIDAEKDAENDREDHWESCLQIEPEVPRMPDRRDRASQEAVTNRLGFSEFVHANWRSLLALGVAISGSEHDAEDLVQSALTNVYPRWAGLHQEHALAYVRRSIVHGNVSRWRRTRRLVPVPDVPDSPIEDGAAVGADRDGLLALVRLLPTRQRAVVTLRYLCDLSDADIAETLGISKATVRSQAMRALATLRHHLDRETS